MVIVRTSRFSWVIILFVSFTSNMLIIVAVPLYPSVLDPVHFVEDILVLAANAYTDGISELLQAVSQLRR